MSEPAILVRGLRKAYGTHTAVHDLDLAVAAGEVRGLLGPNGAGKTTTVEVLEGYRRRDAGEVRVLGRDPGDRPVDLRRRIGIVLQQSGMYRHVRVREALAHFASLYPRPRDVDEVLALVGLDDRADSKHRALSGGLARRLDLALALVGDPELVVLDEPTTGLDPEARRGAWDIVRDLRDRGTTVLLTTHYLDEAQALCDAVTIVSGGRILAEGPPRELSRRTRATVSWRDEAGALRVRETDDPTPLVHALTADAVAAGRAVDDLTVTRASLEDVYLELTREAAADLPPAGSSPGGRRRGGGRGRRRRSAAAELTGPLPTEEPAPAVRSTVETGA